MEHEKPAGTIWNLATVSASSQKTRPDQENLCQDRWSQELPDSHGLLASSSANLNTVINSSNCPDVCAKAWLIVKHDILPTENGD